MPDEEQDSISYKEFMKEETQPPLLQKITRLDLVLSSEELRPLLAVTGEVFSCALARGTWNAQMASADGDVYLDRSAVLETVPDKIARMHQTLSDALLSHQGGLVGSGVHTLEGEPWRPGKQPHGFTVELASVLIQSLELLGALDLEQEFLFALAVKMTHNREALAKGGKS